MSNVVERARRHVLFGPFQSENVPETLVGLSKSWSWRSTADNAVALNPERSGETELTEPSCKFGRPSTSDKAR